MLLYHTMSTNSINQVRASHRKNSKFHLKEDEKRVQDIDDCLTEFDSDSFDCYNKKLKSLQTGLVASDELINDFETDFERL